MFLYVSATFYLLQVGFRACCVAVLGTILPLVAGTLLTMAYQKPFFPMGVAAGTALAPTSVGIALRLLGEAGVLKEDFGQVGAGCSGVEKIGDHWTMLPLGGVLQQPNPMYLEAHSGLKQ